MQRNLNELKSRKEQALLGTGDIRFNKKGCFPEKHSWKREIFYNWFGVVDTLVYITVKMHQTAKLKSARFV